MNEDREMLRRAIEEPVSQMLLTEVSSPQHTNRLSDEIRGWKNPLRAFVKIIFDANSDNATQLFEKCHAATRGWEDDDDLPGLLIVADQTVPDERIAHHSAAIPTSAGFWRKMNLLREQWDKLPCQTIFLVTPQQYFLFSTEADHLKRWIPLKLHILGEEAPLVSRREWGLVRSNDEAALLERSGYDDLHDKKAALVQREVLRERERLATERGDKARTLARRYWLSLFAAAITLEKWEEAARYSKDLKQTELPVFAELRRLRLEAYFKYRTGDAVTALETAKVAETVAQDKGDYWDKITSLWTLRDLYDREKKWDELEEVFQRALSLEVLPAWFLGIYATFLTSVRANHDRAQQLYERALEIDPNDAITLGNYANFLTDVRANHDRAQQMYERVLQADPKRTITLGNYANFLTKVRADHDHAQQLYERALEIDPNYAVALVNYATFLTDVRVDHDYAQQMYERALEAKPNDAIILGNYANFLTDVRADHDHAQQMYERSLEADPKSASTLRNYASFLTDVRADHDHAQQLYESSLETDSNNASTLSSYANFLADVRADYDRAQQLYEQALEVDPKSASTLSNYAVFLCLDRRDFTEAAIYFRKAIEVAPDDPQVLLNAAAFLLSQGNVEEGRDFLKQAESTRNLNIGQQVAIAFHKYIHFPRETPSPLRQLKKVLLDGLRAKDWSFDLNIQRAQQEKHPNIPLLKALARVVTGEARPKILNAFPEWVRTSGK